MTLDDTDVHARLSQRNRFAPPAGFRFRVLGTLDAEGPEGPIALGGPKQRIVLALLLMRANEVVTPESLIDDVWGDEPPDAARNTLQSYVSRLRGAFGADRVSTRSGGYRMRIERDELDATRFEDLVRDAREADGHPDRVSSILRDALALWRGPAFADLATEPALAGEIARLEELRMTATEERISADLELGLHAEVVGELETLTRREPLRERLRGLQLTALYRAGRQADALAAYQEMRTALADELGVDPSPELQRLYERILRQDEGLEIRGEPLRGYRLLEQIGEGAFGVVYRGVQPQVGRDVAVKAIHPDLANQPEFVRRFEREAQLVARLEHPHVVPLYDYWRDPDGAYLVMRYLRGGSVQDLLEVHGPLDTSSALDILQQIALALSAAHRQGVVHRDVKPGNVLLDEDGNAYLSDFGVALDAGAAEQTTGMLVRGTPAYLSPEQIRLEPPTARSDLYALGVVAFEMLTGEHPFPDGSIQALLDRHLHDPLPSVRAVRPDLPPAIDPVIARATAKDAAARFPDTLAFVEALRAAAERRPADAIVGAGARNPYKGLRSFLEPDARDFFGRDVLTRRLVERLAEPAYDARFLSVVGPSGCGKSSVVRAGVVPAIRRGAIEGSDRWFVIELAPGAHPLRELESALLGLAVTPPPSLSATLEEDALGLVRAVDAVLPDRSAELLLVLDQFEELFTLADERERLQVLELILGATREPASRIRTIATLRADLFDQPLAVRGFGELLAGRTEAITPMAPADLERAIVGPADGVGLDVEPTLVAEMVADVVDRPGALPLLQFALTEIAERTHGRLTLDAYRDIGGVSGALARRAEQLYDTLDDDAKASCRQVFLHLVTLAEGNEVSRRRARRSELPSLDRTSVDAVVEAFGRHRLLTFDRDPETREPTIEIAHEAMLAGWGRLETWIDEARDDIRTQRRLGASAGEWIASERDPSFLLSGSRLDQIATWASSTDVALSDAEASLLAASVERRDAESHAEQERRRREEAVERRSRRRLQGLVAVLTAAALVASVLTVIAVQKSRSAERSSRVATARELAAAAMANLDADADRSLLLALRAVETTYAVDDTVLREAEESLHAALQADRLLFSVHGNDHVDVSPDGSRILTGDELGAVHVYDATSGDELLTVEDPDGVPTAVAQQDVAFAPDGAAFASTSGDMWDARTGEEIRRFDLAGSVSFSLAFSPDGRSLAGQAADGGTGVFDVTTGRQTNTIDAFGNVAYAPDGRRLLVADNFGAPDPQFGQIAGYILDPAVDGGGRDRITLYGHQEPSTRGAAWSPDGSMVATSAFPEVLAWDPRTGERLFSLTASSSFLSVAFSPDSARMATGMTDGTTIVWTLNTDGATQTLTLAGDSEVEDVAFTPDGRRLVTAAADGEVDVWDVTPDWSPESVAVPGAQGVALSPDGTMLATSSTSEDPPQPWTTGPAAVHLWDTGTGRPVATLRGHSDEIIALDFDADGTRIASASLDGTARVWDARTGEPLLTLHDEVPGDPRATAFIVDVAFAPDGKTIATTASEGGRIRLWDAATGDLLRTMQDTSGAEVPGNWSVTFSPDGRLLAAPSDGTLFVWDTTDGSVVAHLEVPNVDHLAFTLDGRRLIGTSAGGLTVWNTRTWTVEDSAENASGEVAVSASGDVATLSPDGVVRLWQLEPLRERLVVATDLAEQGSHMLAFAPDGQHLAVSVDGIVSVYALDIDDLIRLARERLTRGFTQQECRQYLHLDRCRGS